MGIGANGKGKTAVSWVVTKRSVLKNLSQVLSDESAQGQE